MEILALLMGKEDPGFSNANHNTPMSIIPSRDFSTSQRRFEPIASAMNKTG